VKPQGYIPPIASPSAHEGADLDIPLIRRIALILAPILALLLFAVALFFHILNREYAHRTSEAAPNVTEAELPPAPRLQMHPTEELQQVRAKEDAHLDHYAWVDRAQGIAQIPIDRAMDLWVKTYTPPLAAGPASTNSPASAMSPGVPPTNAAPAPTELQMRQQKAQEAPHAP
jgi:hypothetical protein